MRHDNQLSKASGMRVVQPARLEVFNRDMKTCKTCSKNFIVLSGSKWGFKRRNKWYCSWSCMRKDGKS